MIKNIGRFFTSQNPDSSDYLKNLKNINHRFLEKV